MLRSVIGATILALAGVVSALAQSEPPQEPVLRIASDQHTAPIHAVAVSPDGRITATTGDDKTIRLWRTSDGEAIDTIRIPIGPGDEGLLYSLAFAPSGRLLLAGGISGRMWDGRNFIYAIAPATGKIRARIPVSGVVSRIVYGEIGGETRIGIALSARQGGAVQIRDARGKVLFEDIDLAGRPSWIDFTPDGDLVVAESGGMLAVYDGETYQRREHRLQADAPAAARPSPDGEMVAVGFFNRRSVDVLRLDDFSNVGSFAGQVLQGEPHLNAVAWRQTDDGAELWAGGAFAAPGGQTIIRKWADLSKADKYRDIAVSDDVITALESTPSGEIVYTASDPAWGMVDKSGKIIHSGRRQGPDFRLVYDRLFAASPDGAKIAFSFEQRGEIGSVVYDAEIGQTRLLKKPKDRRAIKSDWRSPTPPKGLENWRVNAEPTFRGAKLRMALNERALSADSMGDGFVLGGDRGVYVYDAEGAQKARLTLSAAAFGVLSLDDDRFVAGLGDGTLRWYKVDGDRIREIGAFYMARAGQRWLAWLPDGRFDHSENGGQELAGYHVNRSAKEAAEWIEFSQLYRKLYAPEVVRDALQGREVARLAELDAAAAATPEIELLEFCPIIGGEKGQCVDAQLAKRGFGEIEDVAQAEEGATARPVPEDAEAVLIRFKVSNVEDGVSKIDVFQNQRTTGAQTRGIAAIADDPAAEDEARVYERITPLRDGLNRLRVRVYSVAGVYGQSVELELFRAIAGQEERPNLFVLVVGANAYNTLFSSLEFARPDAESIAGLVDSRRPSLYGDVQITQLLDADATAAKIVAAIDEIAAQADVSDSIVLYFAGHGVQTNDGLYRYVTPDVASADDLLTLSLDQDALMSSLGRIKAQNVLLMLDTCYSGAFPASTAGTISNETGLMVLSASNTVEEALDGYDGQNGVFAYALVKALEGDAAGPTGVVDAAAVGAYVRDYVPLLAAERSHSQRPQLFIARNSAPFPLTESNE